jgi:outer membrane protein TolC
MLAWNPSVAAAQVPAGPAQPPGPPLTLTLKDALNRAQEIAPQVVAAVSDTKVAHEDLLQSQAGLRPAAGFLSQYLGTQGNGETPNGRFVTNNGVHVYREWGVIHQDFTPLLNRTAPRRAAALEAMARARSEIAVRGLTLTVTASYYALLAAQRKYGTAQQALDQAQRYLDISQNLERGGEVPHSDVVRAQLQFDSQQRAFREARLVMDTARLDLAVLLFRDFDQNFTIVDDLTVASPLPAYSEIQTMAGEQNPDIRAATSALLAAKYDVKLAREAYLPSLSADFAYGIEANSFALHSTAAATPDRGKLPNLGYFLALSVNIPIWDWGTRSSRVRSARVRQEQAAVDLSATQRILLRNLQGFYAEAQAAREQIDSLRRAVDLAAENLRLNQLRYQAGEATILQLVDAQTLNTQSRNAYDDGLVRYRVALANLQTLTGAF